MQQVVGSRTIRPARGAVHLLLLLVLPFVRRFASRLHVEEALGGLHLLRHQFQIGVDPTASYRVSSFFQIVFEDVLSVKHQVGVTMRACRLNFLTGSVDSVVRVDAPEFLHLAVSVAKATPTSILLAHLNVLGLTVVAPLAFHVESALDRGQRHVVLVTLDQVVNFELKHSLALGVRHPCDNATRVFNWITVSGALRTALEGSTTLANLLVKPSTHAAVHRVQVLVGETDLTYRAIRVEEGVVNDDCVCCSR